MKLQDIIKKYREEHGISGRTFAKMCGLSSGYISMLESGNNPRTGEPLAPTMETLDKIARGMGISLDALFSMLGENEQIAVNGGDEYEWREELRANPDLRMLLSASRNLDAEDIRQLVALAERMNRE